MKTHWLHFVGQQYYSIDEFIKEAKEQGVSRAVSANVFKKMEFGDTILLAQWDGKASRIFGSFTLRYVMGLGEELTKKIHNAGILDKQVDKMVKVDRGCGSYMIKASYSVTDTDAFMAMVKSAPDSEIDRLMIGGDFRALGSVRTNIPFRMGYRLFDDTAYTNAYSNFVGLYGVNTTRIMKGQFYLSGRPGTHVIDDPGLLSISDYRLN